MHAGTQINQSLRSFDQCRQNVGREHIDSEDARNSGLHLHPPLAITDAHIVDYSVETAQLFDLVGNCSCPSHGGEVSRDNSSGAGCRRERVTTSTLVSPVQYDLMALVDHARGKVLGRPKFSLGDRNKLIAALQAGDSWHVVSRNTQIPYSTVKK